jgi:hypothetical protein
MAFFASRKNYRLAFTTARTIGKDGHIGSTGVLIDGYLSGEAGGIHVGCGQIRAVTADH